MKAALRYAYGPPEVLQINDVPKPTLGAEDILIKVYASSVNRTDCGFLQATPFVTRFFSGLRKPKQPILGCEFAGEVTAIGNSVSLFKIGDRAFGFDDSGWGGHGEYKKIRQHKSVVKIPKNITYQQAAVSGEGTHYALSYMHTLQKLGAKRVLVHGATGAIGSAAVQLFKDAGMYVVATSTTKNMKLVTRLGPDKVIDWQTTDFTAYSEEFDVVFDAVGKSSFKACKPLLRSGGVYIATELGPYGQNPFLSLLSPLYRLFGLKRVMFPLPKNNKALFDYIAVRLENGHFKPVIDKSYVLDDIAAAYSYVLTGQKTGNVVIQIV